MKSLLEMFEAFEPTMSIVAGDEIIFKEAVFGGSFKNPKFMGERIIRANILKESYGAERGQHTFSIEVLAAEGYDALKVGTKTTRKGRNIYKSVVKIKEANDFLEKQKDKNTRANKAKNAKNMTWLDEGKFDKLTYEFMRDFNIEIIDYDKKIYKMDGVLKRVF